MPSVFLSHSSQDKPFVRQLADHLRQDPQITVWLDEREVSPGANIVDKIAEALDSDFVLLILSPDSINSAWVKEEWTDAFWDQTNNRRAKLAGVLYRDCQIPRLLRNKKYFDLRTNHPEGFRQIATWLLTGQPAPPPRINLLPTRPPLFVGREADLEYLHQRLQPGVVLGLSGMAGRGKTTLALEFAHRFATQFESIYWLPCQSGSLPSISSDLARQLGLSLTGDINQVVAELKLACARKHCLLILDNVAHEEPGALIPGGAASVLVTTRQPGLRFLQLHPALHLDLFSEAQCFDLFRQVIGAKDVSGHEAECQAIFKRVGHLPLAINLLARLIKYSARHTIASHAAKLPADVTALIKEAIHALPPDPRRLLAAMSACAPEGFRLALASSLADFNEDASLDALDVLVGRSLVEEVDRDQRRYRLHALVRTAANGVEFAQKHAEALNQQFKNWETDWQACEEDLPDFQVALSWALANRPPFAASLAFNGFALTRRIGRPAESFEISDRMIREDQTNNWALQAWFGNQALILRSWGRLEEALALHKKQEALCLELSHKDGLQACYGNQALILQAWGRLEEALALHKQQEALCLELGNKDGLQRSYGNQALILLAWGRLDEALALHKKEEALCLELGNKDGLQASYGNQAGILQAWGRLEEALALHKKEEAICLELGNKAGLAGCYWSLGLLSRAQNDPKTEQEKLTAALALFTELQMPRERDAVAAELEKARGAGAS